jgi:Na+-driven multidrug efflux pump
MLVGVLALELIPGTLLALFDASDTMLSIGIVALRIIAIHFPIAAFCIVTGSVFQALGKSIYSMVTSIMRQLVVLIPAALLLAQLGNVDYVWWAFPIAEVMSAAVTIFFFVRIYHKVIRHLGTQTA